MESYVDRSKIEEVLIVFNKYSEKVDHDKKKIKLLSVGGMDDKMMLQVSFKVPPPNASTYIHNFRPVPHPFHNLADSTICLIVKDVSLKPLPDRDLDLRTTREFYQKRLLEAGVNEDIIKQRLFILPMRELLTEYRMPQMKRRLASSYDVFLADSRLVHNKFKLLPSFLGHKFWIEKKKFPIGVFLKHRGLNLKNSFDRALRTCTLYVTGHGTDSSIQFGVIGQSHQQLADNLEFILKNIFKIYGKAIQILRIKSTTSVAIPFYADVTRPNSSIKKLFPRSKRLDAEPTIGEHPFVEGAEIIVFPSGTTKMKKSVSLKSEDNTAL